MNEMISQYKYNDKTQFNCQKYLSNSSYLLSGLSSGELIFINTETFQKENLKVIRSDEALKSIAISNDDKSILVGDKRGRVNIYLNNYHNESSENRTETQQQPDTQTYLHLQGCLEPCSQESQLKELEMNDSKLVCIYEEKDFFVMDIPR